VKRQLLPPRPATIYECWLAKVVLVHREDHSNPGDVHGILEIDDEAMSHPTEAQEAKAKEVHAADVASSSWAPRSSACASAAAARASAPAAFLKLGMHIWLAPPSAPWQLILALVHIISF
jgi:hypothetical protein